MEKSSILAIQKLYVSVLDTAVLYDINLTVEAGAIHAIMGPNGSGKTTLAYALMGHPQYVISSGTVLLNGIDITDMPVHERARAGLFLGFQHPYEIPGVSVTSFLKEAYVAMTGNSITAADFQKIVLEKSAKLSIDASFLTRGFNEGFSGGEKKRLELLQLLLLRPKVVILDEIDSGLDIDSLKIVAAGIEHARRENPEMSIVLITHYQRILNYIIPDFVHVMREGRIVASGDATVAHILESKGYDAFADIAP